METRPPPYHQNHEKQSKQIPNSLRRDHRHRLGRQLRDAVASPRRNRVHNSEGDRRQQTSGNEAEDGNQNNVDDSKRRVLHRRDDRNVRRRSLSTRFQRSVRRKGHDGMSRIYTKGERFHHGGTEPRRNSDWRIEADSAVNLADRQHYSLPRLIHAAIWNALQSLSS